jgi:hypothetical protein
VKYTKGIVNANEEIFDLAVKYGLIHRPTNQSYLVNDEKIRGRDNAIMTFSSDPSMVTSYDKTIRSIYLGDKEPVSNTENITEESNPLIDGIE